jgi:hypothetical protein
MADHSWLAHPYGLNSMASENKEVGEDRAEYHERGAHFVYSPSGVPDEPGLQALLDALREARQRMSWQRKTAIVDSYAFGPNLWGGSRPAR